MLVYATELCAPAEDGIGWGFAVVLSGLARCGVPVVRVPLVGPRPSAQPDVWLLSLPYAGDVWRLRPFFTLAGEALDRRLRSGRTTYLLGGHGVVNVAPLLEVVDAAFLGEADGQLRELAQAMGDRARLGAVPGVALSDGHVAWQLAPDLSARGCYENSGNRERGVGATTYYEIARGCRGKCRFCEIGWGYGYAERPRAEVDEVMVHAPRNLVLSAPDTSGVSYFTDLLQAGYRPRWRSTRVVTYLRERGTRGNRAASKIRFGVEGVTERLRLLCGKPVSDRDLEGAIRRAITEGYKMVRLFLIGGLPTETASDRTQIRHLLEMFGRAGMCHWKAGEIKITGLSPQPFTPWQRLGIARSIEALRQYRDLHRQLQARDVWWRSVLIDHHSTEADLVKRMAAGQLLPYLAVREPRELAVRRDVEAWATAAGIDYRATVLDDWSLARELPWARVIHPLAAMQAAGEAAWWRTQT